MNLKKKNFRFEGHGFAARLSVPLLKSYEVYLGILSKNMEMTITLMTRTLKILLSDDFTYRHTCL